MGKLLKFEFRKLFRQKSFYICGAVLIGLILLTAISLNAIMSLSETMAADGVEVTVSQDMGLSGLYMMSTALGGSDFSIVLAVFISLFVCGDYTNGTLKNVIAKGFGRTSIFASKYIVSLIAATIFSIGCWLVGFLSGTAFWGVGSFTGDETAGGLVLMLLLQLLAVYAYTSIFFFLSVLLKRTGGSIAVGIVGPLVIIMITSVIDALTPDKSFAVADYWIDNCFTYVSCMSADSDTMIRMLITFSIYLVVFAVGGHLIGRKSEA